MIEPIETKRPLNTHFKPHKHPSPNFSAPSTIASLKLPNPFCFIKSLISSIFNFFKSLFGFQSKIIVKNPMLSNLPLNTAFGRLISSDGKNLSNKRAYELTCELFGILGQGSVLSWGVRKSHIDHLEAEMTNQLKHPLELLYYLFLNKENTNNLVHFKSHAFQSQWNTFISRQAKALHNNQDRLPDHVPGFCTALNLDKKEIQAYISKKQWEELVLYIFNKRKDHFSL